MPTTENMTNLIISILEKCDFNLDQYVYEGKLSIDENIRDEMNTFMKAVIIELKSDEEFLYSLMKSLRELQLVNSWKIESFIEVLESYLISVHDKYSECKFLSKLDMGLFEELINFCFTDRILQITLKYNDNFKSNEIKTTVTNLYLIIENIIVKRYDYDKSFSIIQQFMDLSDEKYRFIYNIIIQNKSDLFNIFLINKLDKLTRLKK